MLIFFLILGHLSLSAGNSTSESSSSSTTVPSTSSSTLSSTLSSASSIQQTSDATADSTVSTTATTFTSNTKSTNNHTNETYTTTFETGSATEYESTVQPTTNFTTSTQSSAAITSVTPTATSTTTPVITTATTITTTTPQGNVAAKVVPAVLVPLFVLIIAAILIFVFRRRIKKCLERDKYPNLRKIPTEPSSIMLPQYTSLVVPADEFLEYFEDMKKECDFKFAEQFESLAIVGRDQSTSEALMKCNLEKNRYVNIHPYDVTRVKLLPVENEDGTDYINASWIPGYYSKREYIAAQGPLPSTIDDMWRMVWEYECKGIIMLTQCMEAGRRKCEFYWPEDSEPVVYGDIQVTMVSEMVEPEKWHVKKLELAVGQQKRTARLFHFIAWPDQGLPHSMDLLLDFMQVVKRELETAKTGPIVIHCSAGVGRTGTYIAIETLLQQLEHEQKVDAYGVVYRMRLSRIFMVQVESQYKFIHEAIAHIINKKNGNTSEETQLLNGDAITTFTNGVGKASLSDGIGRASLPRVSVVAPEFHGIDNPAFDLSSNT